MSAFFLRRALRARCTTAVFAVVLAGCAGTETVRELPNPAVPQYADVEVLPGIFGYWPGADRYQAQLRKRGLSSRFTRCGRSSEVADRLIRKNRTNPGAPIVIVGYSLGGAHAIRVCRRLQSANVPVDKLVLLDAGHGSDSIPGNVRECFHLYRMRSLETRDVPLVADSPKTQFYNHEVSKFDSGRFADERHLTICRNDAVLTLLANAAGSPFAQKPVQQIGFRAEASSPGGVQ